MDAKLYYLIGELKDNFSEKLLREVLDCMENEAYDFNRDDSQSLSIFNGQNERFYEELAKLFVDDINDFSAIYFLVWEGLIEQFNEESKNIFFGVGLTLSEDTDAWDYINGLVKLEEDSPEIALFYFNRIEYYVASYFVGLCYMCLENDENAIKQYLIFIDNFEEVIEEVSTKGVCLKDESGVLITKWNVYNDLGYLYNRIGEYTSAKTYFEKGLDIFNIEANYAIRTEGFEDEKEEDFIIWLNNYLLSLEKSNEIHKCIEVLEIAIAKKPSSFYLKNRLQAFKEVKNTGSKVINQLLSRKKPFNIEKFEITKLIVKEKALEDLIIEQIKYGFKVFGKSLEVYQTDMIFGRQYYIASVNGILDLLLIDKSNDILYVVELKRHGAGIEVVEQIEKYITGLSSEMSREIKGIICVHKPDNQLVELVRTKENIELHSYSFEFKKYE